MAVHHVLGISGGKDSAALAVYMSINRPELDIRYFFTDRARSFPRSMTSLETSRVSSGSPSSTSTPAVTSITGFAPSITFCRLLRRAGARAS